MVRRKDPHWQYVEKLDNNGFKCKFCEAVYAGGVSRIKFHLSSIGGRGIKLCPKVPRDVKWQVTREIESFSRKRKALSNSFEDNNNTDSTSSQNQNNEVRIQARGGEDGNPMEVNNQEQQVEQGNQMDNNIGDSVQYLETRGIELLTTKLVGEAFQRNIDKIWAWLVNHDVVSVAIYGMAGVGKTELAKHINNKLLKDANQFYHVYWFVVPQDFTLYELQNAIAKKVGLYLSDEIDENERAAKLSEALRNEKSILILDDLWNDIDFDKVGIPIRKNECKVIVTTRSLDLCRVMACQKTIKVNCLDEGGDWYLFKEVLGGSKTTLSDEVQEIARDVVRECGGLPLALITMARRMRGVVDIYQWRKVLNKLKGPTAMQDYKDVFQKLKFSYDRLDNSAMQQCFLYCALFSYIDREKLIEYLIVEGIVERKRSRQQEIDEGHSMLIELENVCLLEGMYSGVKMHKWIRKMALQIQSPLIIVETYAELEELPDEKRWTENLLRVLVSNSRIKEIPSNLSPNCPNLSTLLLFSNWDLKLIPYSFLEKLSGLKVLDLSDTCVETLPGSLFNLVGIVALLFKGCKKLRHVPSLANLRELEKLDMSSSGVEEVPEGIELLSKLKYLDLNRTKVEEFPAGMLPNLLCLQFLKLNTSALLLEVELKYLTKLEVLQCGLSEYGSDLRLPLLNECNILIGLQELKVRSWIEYDIYLPCNIEKLVMENCGLTSLCYFTSAAEGLEVLHLQSLKNLQVLLRTPSAESFFLKEIKINKCSSIKNLFTPLLVSNLINLEAIEVSNCSQMEEIIAAAAEHEEELTGGDAITNAEVVLPNLRAVCFWNLKELKSICNGKIICESIQYITIINCPKLKRMLLAPVSPVSPDWNMTFFLGSTDNVQTFPPPLLREIKVYPKELWESLEWDDPNDKIVLEPYVSFNYIKSDPE